MDRISSGEIGRGSIARPNRMRWVKLPLMRLWVISSTARYIIPPAIALLLVAVAWQVWTQIKDVPSYIVPAPLEVAQRLWEDPGFFALEGAVTLGEAMGGFAIGSIIALAAATWMAHSRSVERSLLPIAILVKVTPIVAVAPLFVIWFGFGIWPKMLIAALITFFPTLINGVTGFRSVNPEAMAFLRSLRASNMEIFLTLRIPSAMPYLFSAFRVAIPLSVIGAVVGEWFSADQGLGSVIIVAHSNLDMPTLFGAIFTLAFIGISLTLLVSLVERKVIFWHESSLIDR